MSSQKPTMLFIAIGLKAYGGGNCVAAWALMALREDWDITLLYSEKPDLDAINNHFGTALKNEDFRFQRLPFPLNHLHKVDPDPYSVQELCWAMRYCRRESTKFDVFMTCGDEFDFGRPGIQYTHFPNMRMHLDSFRVVENLSSAQRLRKFLTGRLRPWLLISGIKLSGIKQNLMLTNSSWTAGIIRDTYGVEPVIVYPPALWNGPQTPAEQRRNSFVALGRLSPEKRYLKIIDIIEQVRARGFEIELDIIGDVDIVSGEPYVQKIRNRIAAAGNWVRLNKSVDRQQLEDIVSTCRFGIHGMIDEHFGIAPAELLQAGCIVFVSNTGGQVEIIGDHPELKYDSDEQAVEKICQLLSDQETQSRLRQSLLERSELFSETHFMKHMRQVVADFAQQIPARP